MRSVILKKCKECGYVKSKNLFYGKQNECKECTKIRVKNNSKRVGCSYDRTEKGVIRVIYKTQKSNSKVRGHKPPQYTKEELSSWLYENGFSEIYKSWVDSGYTKDSKPSVDRIDDFKPYQFGNIKLVTWFENRTKQYKDIINDTGTGGLRCKELLREKDGEVKVYPSYNSAVRDIGYSIEYQIKTGKTCRSGYTWKYR